MSFIEFLHSKKHSQYLQGRDKAMAHLKSLFDEKDWGIEIDVHLYTDQNYETIWQHEMRRIIISKLQAQGFDKNKFASFVGEIQTINCDIYWKPLFNKYRANYGWRISILSIPAANVILIGLASHYQQAQSQNALASASAQLYELANKGLGNFDSKMQLPGRKVNSGDWDKDGLFVLPISRLGDAKLDPEVLHLKDIRTTTVKKTISSFINVQILRANDNSLLDVELRECGFVAKALAQGIYPYSNLEDFEHVRNDAYTESKNATDDKNSLDVPIDAPEVPDEDYVAGIEKEDLDSHIIEPFDPTLIRVESKPAVLGQIISRIQHNEIDMAPDFQRKAGIWNLEAKSRLIESILIRIPIPAFYFDGSNENHWVVVDGLQRLTVLRDFVIRNSLQLTGLEFLGSLNGKTYSELPRGFQRRILETSVTLFLIEKDTPANVKFNIFKRINTGGLPLSAQEIRHALNQGNSTTLLKDLAESKEFKLASTNSIKDDRMADRECVLRFIAFSRIEPSIYKDVDFDGFLSEAMVFLNKSNADVLSEIRQRFARSMIASRELFDLDAFRKPYRLHKKRMPINKALFEIWSVNLDRLSDNDLIQVKARKHKLTEEYLKIFSDFEFVSSISQGTGDPRKIRYRFDSISKLLRKVLL